MALYQGAYLLGSVSRRRMNTICIASSSVTAIAETYSSSRSLAAAVIGALNGAAGTYGTVVITSLHYAQQTPTDTGIGEGEEDLPYEVLTQYRIHYTGL